MNTYARVLGVLALLVGAACTTPAPSLILSGQVLDENNIPIVGAHVLASDGSAKGTTNAQGAYSLNLGSTPRSLAMAISADGYATHRAYLQKPEHTYGYLPTHLRRVELSTVRNLPEAGQAPLLISLQHGDANSTLQIEAGDMVDAGGNVAHGSVQVNMTYWHPLEKTRSAPGVLLATPDATGKPVPLKTWGMAALEVLQNGTPLQVAPGQTLIWQVQLPQAMVAYYKVLPPAMQPNLYYLDPNTALWRLDGTLAVDPNRQLFVGTLPHLTEWNMDALVTFDGGCVQGRVMNQCGNPVANTAFTAWFLDDYEVKDFNGTSDSSGNYCLNVGNTDNWGAWDYQTYTSSAPDTTHYRVSGAGNMADSSMCNPLPTKCQTCNEEPLACNECVPVFDYSNGGSCTTPVATIEACHWCPGTCGAVSTMQVCNPSNGGPGCITSCTQLQDVVINDPVCTGTASNPNAALDPNAAGCNASTKKDEGSACDPTSAPCCDAQLSCLDYACVPLTDPGGG